MAERTVSPAVFTNEIDSSFLIQGIGDIGGAVIGPFTKGPAYSPTIIRDVNQLEALFGTPQGIYYQPFTAREYLLNQGVVTIVRTGALEGWMCENALLVRANYVSGSITSDTVAEGDVPESVVIGVLANTLQERQLVVLTDTVTGEPILNEDGREQWIPGELILKKDLASPSETSIGFAGSKLKDRDGIEIDQPLPLKFTPAVYAETNADGTPNLNSELISEEVDERTGTLVLRQEYNTQEVASGNNNGKPEILGEYNFTIDPASPNSLHNIFGRAPQKNVKPAYFTSYFESSQNLVNELIVQHGAEYNVEIETSSGFLDFTSQNEDADGDGYENAIDTDYRYEAYDGNAKGTHACRPASTPWIVSQEISNARYELFRIHTRSYGQSANREIKVGFYNIKTPGTLDGTEYGTFSVIVRGFNDNDKTQDVIEDFRDVTLDPMSPRYLPRVIGDRFTFIDLKGKVHEKGDYVNGSNWIRVEMPKDSTAPTQCMPYGHHPYASTVGMTEGNDKVNLPTPRYSYASQYSRINGRYFCGAVFNDDSPDGLLQPSGWSPTNQTNYTLPANESLPYWSKDFTELCAPIPDGAGTAGEGFYMDEPGKIFYQVDDEVNVEEFEIISANPTSRNAETQARKHRRFIVGFQGGEDGDSPVLPVLLGEDISAKNVQGMDCSGRMSSGTQAYERAFKALSNQDEFDINLLVTPGLSLDLHRSVVNMGVDLCETREDAFYILDCVQANGQPGLVDEAVTQASTIDSNYAATYYPWVKIIDPATNALQVYPPSALMPAVYASNDKAAAEWFAPAGLNRGGLEQAISVMDRLTFAERDTLYEGKVNPIAAFPGQGIVAFGQKTLQRRASALDRINVRRLLISLKKFIASTSRYLLFEQNVAATRNRFLGIVNPYLEAVQQRQGLYAFNVVMDESNNTPDLIDRNILYGQIFLQPARAVEYIILDFNVQATGASFG